MDGALSSAGVISGIVVAVISGGVAVLGAAFRLRSEVVKVKLQQEQGAYSNVWRYVDELKKDRETFRRELDDALKRIDAMEAERRGYEERIRQLQFEIDQLKRASP